MHHAKPARPASSTPTTDTIVAGNVHRGQLSSCPPRAPRVFPAARCPPAVAALRLRVLRAAGMSALEAQCPRSRDDNIIVPGWKN
jgi:hypothetical protein